jgi:hypothetical protein
MILISFLIVVAKSAVNYVSEQIVLIRVICMVLMLKEKCSFFFFFLIQHILMRVFVDSI